MLTFAYYFLQVVMCSCIMLGYYWLVLRNKRFHQYNRFYLLSVALLSWLIPLFKINVTKPSNEITNQFGSLANIVAVNNTEIEQIVIQKHFVINWDAIIMGVYAFISAVFLYTLIAGLFKVYALLKKFSCKHLGDVYLIMTNNVKGTPFSFFKYIFWNDEIDIASINGKQVMQHELTHVREHHSIDKLFIQLLMTFGWFNPFFWLLKKELYLIHEFIADNKSIKNGDTATLAAMLLAAAYPNQQFLLTNPFFFSPIKRRILMLTKTKNPRLSYARRVVVLPMLAITVMLFAFRNKATTNDVGKLDRVYTVVIDAGHGGKDLGATAADGTTEKDLALLMAKALKVSNNNDKIKLVFTREEDIYQSPIAKAEFAKQQHADLFISLHVNWAPEIDESKQGFEINITDKQVSKTIIEQNNLLAKSIANSFQGKYPVVINNTKKNVWVLQNSTCPSVLIECGYINYKNDLLKLKDENQRNKMAGLILEGITSYLKNKQLNVSIPNKIEQKIKTQTPENKIHEVVAIRNITSSISDGKVKNANSGYAIKSVDTFIVGDGPKIDTKKALLIVDGNVMNWDVFQKLVAPNSIQKMNIIKGNESIAKYGEDGKYGVVLVITKNLSVPITISSPLNNSYVAQPFGKYKPTANSSFESNSDGWLVKSKTDEQVKSISNGIIVFTGNVGGENVVIVRGENYLFTYSKLGDLNVGKNDVVTKNTVLGKAGVEDGENAVFFMVSNKNGLAQDPSKIINGL